MEDTTFEQALDAITGVLSTRRKDLAPPVVALHKKVLRHFADTGQAPDATTVRSWVAELGVDADTAIENLIAVDLIEADASTVTVHGAYPFVADHRGHRVQIEGGATVNAYCAVDALGVPPMLDRTATITATDPHTGEPIRITVHDENATWEPPETVVTLPADTVKVATAPVDEINDNPQAADAACPTINFYVNAEAAAAYAKAHGLQLEILTMPQALRGAKAAFGDLL